MWLFFCNLHETKFITMSKLSEIVYNIKNLQNKGTHTDDVKLGDRQLEFIINHFRAELAAQRYNTNKSLEGFYQELVDVKLESTKDFRPYRDTVGILKSKIQLPSFATSHLNGNIVNYVGPRDEFLGFQQSSVNYFNLDLENPFILNTFFTVNNYLYVATKEFRTIREVFVRGVISNPRKGIEFNSSSKLMGLDWEYPIPEGLIGQLNNMIINNEYRWMSIVPSDLLNDGKDAEQQGN